MTKTFIKGALLAAVAFAATPALAANPEPFTATATIVKPIEITKADDLNFGTITMGSALVSSTVSVAASDGAISACGAALTCSGTSKPAKFDVVGFGNLTADLTYVGPTQLTNASGDTVDFTLDGNDTVTLTNGAGTFYAGGTITVATATAPGVYTADFEVSADYQ